MRLILFTIIVVMANYLNVFGQKDRVMVEEKWEEIYLQTDRDIYITGEEVWFRADYNIFGKLSTDELSKSLYIELVTPLGESVSRQKYAIVDGIASGNYSIPEGLLTATYMLRVYTQFQRNYPKEYFTTNLIMVINPSVPLIGYQDNLRWKLQVIPEGQGIVNGNISKVAFRIHPKMIKKLTSLKVTDQFENVVSDVKTYDNGLGITEFLVNDSLEYGVTAYFVKGDSIHKIIPKAKNDFILKSEFTDATVKVKLTATDKEEEKKYSIGLYDGYLVRQINQEISADDNWHEIEMDDAFLDSDFKYLVLRNQKNEVVQVVSNYQLHREIEQIEVETQQRIYKTRSKVDVSFIPDGEIFDNYSVSVVKKGTFEKERSILPEFIIANPQLLPSFIDNRLIDDEDFAGQLNAALIIYEDMLKSDPSFFKDITSEELEKYWAPETRGITIRGVVRHIKSLNPEPYCDVYVAVIGAEPQLHVYTTNIDGEFIFTLKHVSGIQNLFLCVDSKKESELEILVNSDFVNNYESFYATPTILDTSMQKFIQDIYVNAQLEAYVALNETDTVIRKYYKPIRFPEPSASILLDDYIALPTLRDVINEIVPYVKVQKKKDDFSLEVLDPATNQVYGDPLILIDNLPVFNVNELIKINPELIKRISVINSTYVYGEHMFRGIVFFETNTNNFAGIELPVSSTFLEFQAAENVETFKTTLHSDELDKSKREPDFRNVLYWNPDVQLIDGSGTCSFTTSDYEGDFEVIVRGVNEKGKISMGTTNFKVIDK